MAYDYEIDDLAKEESWRMFRILGELVEGFDKLAGLEPAVEASNGNGSNLCLSRFSKDEHRVMTAETKGVGQGRVDLSRAGFIGHIVQVTFRVRVS